MPINSITIKSSGYHTQIMININFNSSLKENRKLKELHTNAFHGIIDITELWVFLHYHFLGA